MSAALQAARDALRGHDVWLVGGAVRDRLMGREVADVDLVVEGDVRRAARHLGVQAGGPAFPLSEAHGAWRVIGPGRAWQIDLSPLAGASIRDDLARRDFSVNAIAEPLAGGELVDPHGGADDLAAHRLRMVAPDAFARDGLRVMRLARLSCELGLEPDRETEAEARRHAGALREVAGERVLAELVRVVGSARALDGLELMERTGATQEVLPELTALRGVEQNRFHHLDVHDHTLAVLQATIDLEDQPEPVLGPGIAAPLAAVLAEPLADELDRGMALRFGALLHDIAKPQTQVVRDDGTVLGFPDHAAQGAAAARAILTRLRASERLRAHVAALAAHHLRLGFLVHERPLSRRALHGYLVATGTVGVDVTVLSVADRLATRGDRAREAIAKHVELAREVLPEALAWRAAQPLTPLVRGDDLARALGLQPGPRLGALLADVAAARFAGEVATPEEAVAYARGRLSGEAPTPA